MRTSNEVKKMVVVLFAAAAIAGGHQAIGKAGGVPPTDRTAIASHADAQGEASSSAAPTAKGGAKNKKKAYKRTYSAEYRGFSGYYVDEETPSACLPDDVPNCVVIPLGDASTPDDRERKHRRKERFVELQITDEQLVGDSVLVVVTVSSASLDLPQYTFCNATEEPIEIEPFNGDPFSSDVALEIRFFVGTCADGSLSLPTQGKVEATFYKKDPRRLKN